MRHLPLLKVLQAKCRLKKPKRDRPVLLPKVQLPLQ